MMLKIVCNKACSVYSLLPALLASFYTTFPLILWAKCTLPFHQLLNSLRLYLWANTSVQVASMFPSPPHLNMCVWIFTASSPFASSISHLKCYFFMKVFFLSPPLAMRTESSGPSLMDFILALQVI